MKIIRYSRADGEPEFGWVLEEAGEIKIGSMEGSPFGEYMRKEAEFRLEDISIGPPVQPSKIICVGRNYIAHAEEHGTDVPDIPLLFLKPPSSLIGMNDIIYLPPQSQQVEHEAELAVVIGKKGRWISHDEAFEYVLGYTIANDVTARDLQQRDDQWTRGKGFDTFCPIGPWIETEFDPADALISCYVNGEMRQMASTRDMVFPVQQLIAFASSVMTLEPGDLILTGTPAGVGPLLPGDEVEVAIEGLGVLKNTVEMSPGNA